jgi:hypothetical protein
MMGRCIEALCTLCAYESRDVNPHNLDVWPRMLTGMLPSLASSLASHWTTHAKLSGRSTTLHCRGEGVCTGSSLKRSVASDMGSVLGVGKQSPSLVTT